MVIIQGHNYFFSTIQLFHAQHSHSIGPIVLCAVKVSHSLVSVEAMMTCLPFLTETCSWVTRGQFI